MRSLVLLRVGAGAAVVGGGCWIAKGGSILVSGRQPDVLFAAGGFLFPIALLGLAALLGRQQAPRRRGGGTAAAGAIAVGVGLLVVLVVQDDPSEAITGSALAAIALCTLTSLLLLGAEARRSDALPSPWAGLPWFMGLALLPSMTLVGGLLEVIHERLLELPIVAYGLAWVILGLAMFNTPTASVDPLAVREARP